ncbi:MAG: hypothetical protein CR988_03825 [Treponema sp.]|nr:MAG: hypothetical protein CR988_03825 [Treponema sp.]
MENKSYLYVPLSKRNDLNSFVRHIKSVIGLLEDGSKKNIADSLNEMLGDQEIAPDQVLPIMSVTLLEKWKYSVASVNLEDVCNDAEKLVSTVAKWKGVDIVLGYQHPDLGFLAFNPKNPANKGVLEGLKKNELLHIYVGKGSKDEIDEKLASEVIDAMKKLIYNKKVTVSSKVTSGSFTFVEKKAPTPKRTRTTAPRAKKTVGGRKAKTPARSAVSTTQTTSSGYTNSSYEVPEHLRQAQSQSTAPIGRKNMSNLISVVVSNELFHNGNVEAWKRIIRSYNARYPNAEVIVYYDGERIVDINTLFKWGKVKHGSTIQFAVAADEIRDLSKLRKYFSQGASPRFEDFLHGSPDTVLNLF